MNKISIIVILIICYTPLYGQFYQGLYTMKNTSLNRLVNPSAEARYEKEFLAPFLISHIQIQTQFYGITAAEIFSNESANATIESFIRNKTGKEHVWVNNKFNIVYAGFNDKNNRYWSFGIYQENHAYIFYPSEIIDLAYNGNANNIGRSYDLGGLRGQATAMMVYHLGISYFPERKRYSLGARIKIYNSFASVDINGTNGEVTTLLDENNIASILIDGKLRVKTSIMEDTEISDISKNMFLSGNMGLGVDMGMTYFIEDNLYASASIIDLGMVYNSFNTKNYTAKGIHNYQGTLAEGSDTEGNTNIITNAIEDLKQDINYSENNNSYFALLPTKIFASLNYVVSDTKIKIKTNGEDCCSPRTKTSKHHSHTFSLNSYNKVLYNYWDWAIGISYLGELNNKLAIQANYLYSPYDPINFGAGFSVRLGNALIYLSVDNIPAMLDIYDANSLGFMIGINLVFDKNQSR